MRDIAMLIAMLVFIPLAFSNVAVGYLIWGWTAFVAINFYMYGFMSGVPFNMIFAIISIITILAAKDKDRQPFSANRVVVLYILFAVQASVTAAFALDGNSQNEFFWSIILKMLLFCILMPMVITTRLRIHAMTVMLTLGLAVHGVVEGAKVISSGGGHNVVGLPKFGDNNHFAMLVVMAMPLCLYLFQYSASKLVRLGSIAGLVFSIAAVIGTHSRGGLLSMLVAGAWLVWGGRRKALGVAVLIAGAGLVIALAPQSWSDRMNTIKTAEEDSSFLGRVEAWRVSSAIALARPLTGGGFHGVESQLIWVAYRDKPSLLDNVQIQYTTAGRAAHSVYFEVLGDTGFIGLFLFVAIIATAFMARRDIRKRCKAAGTRLLWASDLADTLSAVLFAYVVGGAALSVAYFEAMYGIVMLMEVLRQYVIRDTKPLARAGV